MDCEKNKDASLLVQSIENNLDGSSNTNIQSIRKYNREFILKVCKSFNKPSGEYKPKETFDLVLEYVKSNKKLPRLFYSEISANVFQIQNNESDFSSVIQNIDSLADMVFERYDSQVDDRSKIEQDQEAIEIVLKIYDHIHLVGVQIEQIGKVGSGVDKAKSDLAFLNKELKNSQRDYIPVLGIFATVVVTFMGGMTFSSATLAAMNLVTVYRLTGTIILLGFVLFNLINVLMKFLLLITGKIEKDRLKAEIFSLNITRWNTFSISEKVNFILFVLLIVDLIMWFIDICLLRIHFVDFYIIRYLGL